MDKKKNKTEDVRRAIIDILKYIKKYPDAKHTKKGIISNWIYQQRIEENTQTVEEAIDYLINEGILEKVLKEDESFYLRVNRDRNGDILSKLEEFNRQNNDH
ncbi:hypothetical protein H8E88_07865 [candidate division KSB1 bacterium]|nr:hypothetical protein [candidate division KSB1 bacterium]